MGRLLDKTVATCIGGQFLSKQLLRDVMSFTGFNRTSAAVAAAASANYTLQTTLGEKDVRGPNLR